MGLFRVRLASVVMIGLLVASLAPLASAKQPLAKATAPFDGASQHGFCYEDCTYAAQADKEDGTIHLEGQGSTPEDHYSFGRSSGILAHQLVLPTERDAVVFEAVVDVEATTEVTGPGSARVDIFLSYEASPPGCYGCNAKTLVLADSETICCDDEAPSTVGPERRLLRLLLFDWDGAPVPAGPFDVGISLESDFSVSNPINTPIAGGISLSGNPLPDQSEPTTAAYDVTLRLVSLSLVDAPRPLHKKELAANKTYTAVAPYEDLSFYPSCANPCAKANASKETGAMQLDVAFEGLPTESGGRDAQEVYLEHTIHVPTAADSARTIATLRLDEAIANQTGNGYAYVEALVRVQNLDCWGCSEGEARDLVGAGTCSSCNAGAAELRDQVLTFDLTLQNPEGHVLPPGDYEILVMLKAEARPDVTIVPGVRGFVTGPAEAHAKATLESLSLEVDPAQWPPQ